MLQNHIPMLSISRRFGLTYNRGLILVGSLLDLSNISPVPPHLKYKLRSAGDLLFHYFFYANLIFVFYIFILNLHRKFLTGWSYSNTRREISILLQY
jgi:hypothetical protein